jgi:hypothetical protein
MITLTCVMGVDPDLFDLNLIYHFIDHYRLLGIEKFFITVNAETPEKTYEGIRILGECGVAPKEVWIGPYYCHRKHVKLLDLQLQVKSPWTLVVDADEFLCIDKEFLSLALSKNDHDAFFGKLVDRYSNDPFAKVTKGLPPELTFPLHGSFLDQYNKEKGFTRALTKKCFLLRTGLLLSSNGQHFAVYKKNTSEFFTGYHPIEFIINHFKWTPTVLKRLQLRAERYRKDDFCGMWVDEIDWLLEKRPFL